MSAVDVALICAPGSLPPPLPAVAAPRPLNIRATVSWTLAALTAAVVVTVLIFIPFATHEQLSDVEVNNLSTVGLTLGCLPLIGILAFACRRWGWRVSEYLALTRPRGRYVWLALGGFALAFAASATLSLFGSLADDPDTSMNGLVATLFGAMILAPIWEELIFRGFLYRGLAASRLGTAGTIVLTALIWASLHFDKTWLGFTDIFVAGLVLGWLRWRTGSTYVTIAVHAMQNAIAGAAITAIALGWAT